MPNPTWQELYNTALVEFDLDKLPERVEAACQAIHQHQEQKGHTLTAEERRVLDDALRVHCENAQPAISSAEAGSISA